MDLSTLISRCKSRFRDPNGDIYDTTAWTNYLNEAYRDVWGASPFWPWRETESRSTLTVTSGSRSVSLPTDATRVTAVRNATDDILMTAVDDRETQWVLDPEDDDEGTPWYYRVRASTIEVFPLPTQDTVLDVDYFSGFTALSGNSDEPSFPEQFHTVLIFGALAYAYEDDGNFDAATVQKQRYEAKLQEMRVELLSGNQDRYPGITDTFFDR